jgi:hypothetical protein
MSILVFQIVNFTVDLFQCRIIYCPEYFPAVFGYPVTSSSSISASSAGTGCYRKYPEPAREPFWCLHLWYISCTKSGCAISAAVSRSIEPALLIPSMTNIITRLQALLSFSSLALAIPSPIAVASHHYANFPIIHHIHQ